MTHQNNWITIFTEKEKQVIVNKLTKQFGITKVEGIILRRGAERLFLYQGAFSKKDIKDLEHYRINLERTGVYFAKLSPDKKVRLSIEGVHILKDQITKNIFELTKEQAKQWMEGSELNIKTGKKEFLIMKYKDYFLGCGKASELKISNYIPKNRRLKIKD